MMVVLVVESVPASLRGRLTRWLLQVHAGVFVGHLSARVRDLLWERVRGDVRGGYAAMIVPADTDQGFTVRTHGRGKREVVDMEGLFLTKKQDF